MFCLVVCGYAVLVNLVWLVVCGYAVWIACGWSLVVGVSVALISCWQADERAVSPCGGTPG